MFFQYYYIRSVPSITPLTAAGITGGVGGNGLLPCLVCYPGGNNYSLVWLPYDSTAAATTSTSTASSSQVSVPSLPSTSTSNATQSSTVTATPTSVSMVTSPPALSPPHTTSGDISPAVTPNNPLLPSNLSAAITQSYLQLLQLQQLQQQQQANSNNAVSASASIPFVSPHSSFISSNNDILTQSISTNSTQVTQSHNSGN